MSRRAVADIARKPTRRIPGQLAIKYALRRPKTVRTRLRVAGVTVVGSRRLLTEHLRPDRARSSWGRPCAFAGSPSAGRSWRCCSCRSSPSPRCGDSPPCSPAARPTELLERQHRRREGRRPGARTPSAPSRTNAAQTLVYLADPRAAGRAASAAPNARGHRPGRGRSQRNARQRPECATHCDAATEAELTSLLDALDGLEALRALRRDGAPSAAAQALGLLQRHRRPRLQLPDRPPRPWRTWTMDNAGPRPRRPRPRAGDALPRGRPGRLRAGRRQAQRRTSSAGVRPRRQPQAALRDQPARPARHGARPLSEQYWSSPRHQPLRDGGAALIDGGPGQGPAARSTPHGGSDVTAPVLDELREAERPGRRPSTRTAVDPAAVRRLRPGRCRAACLGLPRAPGLGHRLRTHRPRADPRPVPAAQGGPRGRPVSGCPA